MKAKRRMVIYFMDGTNVSFKYPKQEVKEHSIQSVLEKFVQNQQLIIEAEGTIFMFPYSNIKYIKITPSDQAMLPEVAIKNASLLG